MLVWEHNFLKAAATRCSIRELKQPRRRRQHERHKFAYLTMKNSIFTRFARASFIFWHFEDVLVLSTTWNDLFCSCVDDVIRRAAYDDECSILSSYVPSAGSNLIPGQLEHIFQAWWLWIIEKWLQKREVNFQMTFSLPSTPCLLKLPIVRGTRQNIVTRTLLTMLDTHFIFVGNTPLWSC